ncbi:hypothetical protein J1N35_014371 [Gossypium stocksii]|uniref:Pentacotripeptide-repeat region of PRORP domain-containing protein n=1 Tax=Gossypium stocksii TaxID=47602 RepID=A0A9D3VTY8_9ROSI|nr:hypothetical protein J1N35_014371 [Gossypium stocksii]
MMVLKQMESEDVKPDSHTYSYLIANCNCEEDITKYCEEMKAAGIQVTKHIFMALINAYTACGQIEKAKQLLQRLEYFGQYGKVLKVSMSRTVAGTIQQFPNNTCNV